MNRVTVIEQQVRVTGVVEQVALYLRRPVYYRDASANNNGDPPTSLFYIIFLFVWVHFPSLSAV